MNCLKKLIVPALLMLLVSVQDATAQGLKGFKLKNGLTVYIWEDDTKPDIYGMVGVKVGAANDPEELTGLSHYLEHMLFKGTQTISAADWAKEKPLYDQIVALYDQMADETDPAKKKSLNAEINKLSIEASKFAAPTEFSNLTEAMGGTGLNAATSYDETFYYSTFPPSQLYKWLDLNSERFINPVFRGFQSELETVYEEFNMGQDEQGKRQSEFMLKHIFPNHPYSRSVIGLQEHLKNPRLSGLIKFYNDWYVPENMVLILVGNVKQREVVGLINDRFGRLKAKPSPVRKTYPEMELTKRVEYKAKIGDYPSLQLAYKTVPSKHADNLLLQVCVSLLNNSNRTGLLDRLTIDGEVLGANASLVNFKEQGRLVVSAVPYYDAAQRRFYSMKSLEKTLQEEIKKLQNGEIEEWQLTSVKGALMRDFDLSMESSEVKGQNLLNIFTKEQDLSSFFNYKELVNAITIDQIKAVAQKYFTDNYIVLNLQPGKGEKAEKLEKPNLKPLDPQRNAVSPYAERFKKLPVRKIEPVYENFADVQITPINQRSRLFYTSNPASDIFTLTLKYGVGTREMPKLEYAAALMNNAGVMGQLDPLELKREMGKLGVVCNFSVSEDYLVVSMSGFEANLQASCNLLTRQLLMPKLDDQQLNNLLGAAYQGRMIEAKNNDALPAALQNYMLYGERSDYIDRLKLDDILNLSISELTGEFNRATDYEAEVHYTGSLPFAQVHELLSKNLPLKAQEKASISPVVKPRTPVSENTVYFVADKEALQSKIYFYVEGDAYDIKDETCYEAFNKYFGSGFGGLVMQEVREYRSMAYTADGGMSTPPLAAKPAHFMGFIGTQADKTLDALKVFMGLVNDMPQHPERIANIKDFLREAQLASKPSVRARSQTYEFWKRLGYDADPRIMQIPLIEALTFDDINRFYEQKLKGRPIAIAIVGDPNRINLKELENYGKIVKINKKRLFSED